MDDMTAFVNKFLDEYEEKLRRENPSNLPFFHIYNGFGFIVATLENEVYRRCREFEDVIKEQLEELDNIPLTRKQYEEKKEEIQSRENVFASLVRYPEKNRAGNQVFYREITRRYMKAVLSEGLNEQEIEEEFRQVWEGMDFYAMFFYFETGKYKYAEDEGHPMSEHYVYGYDSDYTYQENMLRHLLSMIRAKYCGSGVNWNAR